jgi:hypothetical protein
MIVSACFVDCHCRPPVTVAAITTASFILQRNVRKIFTCTFEGDLAYGLIQQ